MDRQALRQKMQATPEALQEKRTWELYLQTSNLDIEEMNKAKAVYKKAAAAWRETKEYKSWRDLAYSSGSNKCEPDPVNHPVHYTSHPSGVEAIDITRHMNFNLGNAVKYIWRAGLKGDNIEDLQKARFYISDELERLSND